MTVMGTLGPLPDRQQEITYTDLKVIGSGSFGVVYQAKLLETNEPIAIKKVLQDKRFKVTATGTVVMSFYDGMTDSGVCVCVCFNLYLFTLMTLLSLNTTVPSLSLSLSLFRIVSYRL